MICVDGLSDHDWRYGLSCHLFSSIHDVDELHEFAGWIGLQRKWFQDDPRLPHYDITGSKRHLAIKMGAKVRSVRDVLRRAK